MKILINDTISENGKIILEENGFEVITTKVADEQLENFINENFIDAILVNANTSIEEELIEACSSLKLIACNSNSLENIDVAYAENNGLIVINITDATSNAAAELVFAHLLGMVRFLHQANREMPLEGELSFNALKKQYASGSELKGKTLGIIGMNTIGQEVARIALGIGMSVIASDNEKVATSINIPFFNGQSIDININMTSLDEIIKKADFISFHIPAQENYIIGASQIDNMKNGVGLINVTHGRIIDEVALVNAIESGKVKYAGLDVFENQPTPEIQLLMNPEISLSPNIATSTIEAKEKAGVELANKITQLLA